MYAEIWPNFYLADKKPGRPAKNRDTVSLNRHPQSETQPEKNRDTVSPLTAKTIAEATGKSEKQVKRDRKITTAAAEKAKAEGFSTPSPDHIKQAREEANKQRRQTEAATPDIKGALDMLNGWITKSSPSYKTGVDQCLMALSVNGVLSREVAEEIRGGLHEPSEG
jgi:hypothetical protein